MAGTLTIPNSIGAQPGPTVAASLFDANWAAIATYVNAREISFGLLSARPTAGVAGRWYYATDTGGLFADAGGSWVTAASTASGVVNQRTGLGLTRTSGTAITVAAGAATSDDATLSARVLMSSLSGIQGNTAGTWVVGTNQNKLDVGAIAVSTWYHVFLIERPDTGVVDILFSLSPTAPTLPTAYTKQRRIGSFKTDGASAILNFVQTGKYFVWLVAVLDVNTNNPGIAAVSATLASVPTGIPVTAMVVAILKNAGTASSMQVTDLSATDAAPPALGAALVAPMFDLINTVNPSDQVVPVQVRTNATAQIRYRLSVSDANITAGFLTRGWLDDLGDA